jgi:hypothetical protein
MAPLRPEAPQAAGGEVGSYVGRRSWLTRFLSFILQGTTKPLGACRASIPGEPVCRRPTAASAAPAPSARDGTTRITWKGHQRWPN